VTLPRVSSLDCLERSLGFSLGPQYGSNSASRFYLWVTHCRGRYMSTGLGRGNAYGLAAVCGALFPFMMFGRLYWPGPPMTNILFFVTAMLVSSCAVALESGMLTFTRSSDILGTIRTPSLLRRSRTGVSVLRSCVLSIIGRYAGSLTFYLQRRLSLWLLELRQPCKTFLQSFVTLTVISSPCSIFSFLPPSTTLRKYQRTSLATATGELGAIYCSIVSFANTGEHTDQDIKRSRRALLRSEPS
jgi:hypothetical protein